MMYILFYPSELRKTQEIFFFNKTIVFLNRKINPGFLILCKSVGHSVRKIQQKRKTNLVFGQKSPYRPLNELHVLNYQ